MFEKFMQAAERTADGVSRRQFFGRLGWAALAATAAAGVLAAPGTAQAGPPIYCHLRCQRLCGGNQRCYSGCIRRC